MSVWVASDAGLAQAAAQWGEVIGLDTEFQRTNTFFPIPGLYQVATPSGTWLIDPLAIGDWTPFVEMLTDPHRVKVLHACSEDLELIYRHLNAQPVNLFDTQLAFAFVSENFGSSYANLIEALLGVALAKHQTRSDWLQRPLSADQLRYAEEDVAHLLAAHSALSAQLRAAGRWHWFVEDMQRGEGYAPRAPEAYFAGIKSARRLDGRQLAVLKSLCAWRERQAMADDVPRNRVVWDEHLLAFARGGHIDWAELRRRLPPRIVRRHGQGLIDAFGEGLAAPEEPPLPRPLTKQQTGVLKRLRGLGREQAKELGMAPELLARQRDWEECIRCYVAAGVLSETFLGWRRSVLGAEFVGELRALRGNRATHASPLRVSGERVGDGSDSSGPVGARSAGAELSGAEARDGSVVDGSTGGSGGGR